MNKNIFGIIFIIFASQQLLNEAYPCEYIDCGLGYTCESANKTEIDNDFICIDIKTKYSVLIEKGNSLILFPNKCPTVKCENKGICRIDFESMNSSCICQYPFTGKFCEINSDLNDVDNKTGKSSPGHFDFKFPQYFYNHGNFLPHNPPLVDICKMYRDSNVDYCKNGGHCYIDNAGKADCICPVTARGQFCEDLVYVFCPSSLQLCHRSNGKCLDGDKCICNNGYEGPRCDEIAKCSPSYCLNGGTCVQSSTAPFRSCTCTSGRFTGSRCENEIITTPRPITTTTTTKKKPTERCSYHITLRNDGFFLARLRVSYTLDGIKQKAIVSESISILRKIKPIDLPDDAEDVTVKIEYLNLFTWKLIYEDDDLGIETECQKCYKTWGNTIKPKWDYLFC